ncbi:MAG: hypothetical protein ABI580_14955, partial [Burkholderiaceae bacterium]
DEAERGAAATRTWPLGSGNGSPACFQVVGPIESDAFACRRRVRFSAPGTTGLPILRENTSLLGGDRNRHDERGNFVDGSGEFANRQ